MFRIVTLVSLLFVSTSWAQVTFTAPKEAVPGAICKIDMDVKGQGMVLAGFKDGLPTNDHLVLKTLDDKPIIFLVPPSSGVYTFVASVISEGKVAQTSVVVVAKNASPPTPQDTFSQAIKQAYAQNPSADGAKVLADIYEQVSKVEVPTVAAIQLSTFCKDRLKPDTLKAVKLVVEAELGKGNHKDVLSRAATILRGL